jgi:hypothetical protein
MSPWPHRIRTLCVLLVLSTGFCAQAADAPATSIAADAPKPSVLPPPPLKCPIEMFRNLLARSPGERERLLTNKPPVLRKRILEKVREYEAMRPDERALRLKSTELRWYLRQLMPLSAEDRAAQLAALPETDRQMVADRLKLWDLLPPDLQRQVLQDSPTNSPPSPVPLAVSTPPEDAEGPVRRIAEWNAMPAEQRQEMFQRFEQFFELTEAEKEKTLHVLSGAEIAQMQRALQTFGKLQPARQQRCLQSFPKFAGMSEDERREFLENAERWKEMSPTERQVWRNLVSRLPAPPVPPGLGVPLPPFPGLPPGIRSPVGGAAGSAQGSLATNGNP